VVAIAVAESRPPVVEVSGTVLEKDSKRLDWILTNQRGIEIAAGNHRLSITCRAIGDRRVAPYEADHIAKLIGPIPRHGKRGDRTAARAADGAAGRIGREVVALPDFRKHFPR